MHKNTQRDRVVTVPNELTAPLIAERLSFATSALATGQNMRKKINTDWRKDTIFEDEFGFVPKAGIQARKVLCGPKTQAIMELTNYKFPMDALVEKLALENYSTAVIDDTDPAEVERLFDTYWEAAEAKFSHADAKREPSTVFLNGFPVDAKKSQFNMDCDSDSAQEQFPARTRLRISKKKMLENLQFGVVFSWHKKGKLVEFFDRSQDKRTKKPREVIKTKTITAKYFCKKSKKNIANY